MATQAANKKRKNKSALKALSPLSPCCIKCGNVDIGMQYCNDYASHSYLDGKQLHGGADSVIHCHCRACGYNWNEVPLDERGAK